MHEVSSAESTCELLGWILDGVSGLVRPTARRLWRLKLGIRALLSRGACSGKTLERLVGHATFVALIRRESLSCFSEVYIFIRRFGKERGVLPPAVRKELSVFSGLIPLLVANLQAQWSPEVLMCDASFYGRGSLPGGSRRHLCARWVGTTNDGGGEEDASPAA